MNERIIELAKQALLEHCVSHVRLEDFANRIIMQCIGLCDQVDLVGADDCINNIKEHFGVKE